MRKGIKHRVKSSQLIVFTISAIEFATFAAAGRSEDNHLKDKAFIRAAANKMGAAFLAKDAEGYVAYSDPNFVNVDLSGKKTTHGKEERHQKLVAVFDNAAKHNLKIAGYFAVRSITFSSEGATVISESDITYSGNVNGQARVLRDHDVSRDFWVKSSAGWLQRRSRDISEKVTVNGQPVS